MLWTDFPKNWFDMSEKEKFRWFAQKYCISSSEISSGESFFVDCENSPGVSIAGVSEYDFSYFKGMEKILKPILQEDGIKEFVGDIDTLCRMTASALLKNKPYVEELLDPERWKNYSGVFSIADTLLLNNDNKQAPVSENSHSETSDKNGKPPEFYYPM